MSDREKAELRGPVAICVQEVDRGDGRKSSTTTEYSLDGKLLATRTSHPDGSEWIITQTYDADGRLVKIISGKMGEPSAESLYAYDEGGRLLTITNYLTILAARKLIDMDPDKPSMAKQFLTDRAIEDAAFILERIDARWPTIVNSFSAIQE